MILVNVVKDKPIQKIISDLSNKKNDKSVDKDETESEKAARERKLRISEENKYVHEIYEALWDKDPKSLKPDSLAVYNTCLKYVPTDTYDKNLSYDLKTHFNKYLKLSLNMNKELEEADLKLFQPISLRKSLIPKHMPIDTKGLLYLMDFDNLTKYTRSELFTNYKSIDGLEHLIWNQYFKLDKKVFTKHKNYTFCSIETDGVSVCLKFIENSQLPKRAARYKKRDPSVPPTQPDQKKKDKKSKPEFASDPNKLISNYTDEEKAPLFNRRIVGADPGMFNLIQLASDNKSHLRYTRKQRAAETYIAQNAIIRAKMQKAAGIKQIEKSLNDCKSKTVNTDKFKIYIKEKLATIPKAEKHYRQSVYRKLNLRKFIHTKKSEDKLLNNIEKTFGADCVIAYGNWSRTTSMKYNPPVPGIGLKRKIASRFTTGSENEAYSSCTCPYCKKRVKNFRDPKNKKIYRCLVCTGCSSLKNGSKVRYANRDISGALNIREIFMSELAGKGRPDAFKLVKDQVLSQQTGLKTTVIRKKILSMENMLDKN